MSSLLYNFLLQNLPSGSRVALRANGGPNVLVVDGMSLMSTIYPLSLDWILPPWKELHARVQLFVRRFTELGFQLTVFFNGMLARRSFLGS